MWPYKFIFIAKANQLNKYLALVTVFVAHYTVDILVYIGSDRSAYVGNNGWRDYIRDGDSMGGEL